MPATCSALSLSSNLFILNDGDSDDGDRDGDGNGDETAIDLLRAYSKRDYFTFRAQYFIIISSLAPI